MKIKLDTPERQSGRPGEGSSSNLPGTGISAKYIVIIDD